MSPDHAFLALRLKGPLQSWGFDSLYNRRKTGLFPSKSAVSGMICAALGYPRGSEKEHDLLENLSRMPMLSIRMPVMIANRRVQISRLTDYHTVQGTRTADGKVKDTHITYRQYLQDVSFGIVLDGVAECINTIGVALKDPIWGISLGRKCCIPTAPVFAGIHDSKETAIAALTNGQLLNSFTYQEDSASFAEGEDTLSDVAVSFASHAKAFAPRRVRVRQARHEA